MERMGLDPGTEVGGYRIVSPLGSGAMGAVYRAVDGGGHVVAFKVLHSHVAADAEMRARLNREIAALRRVDHPAVAHLLDAEPDASEMFIVTELVDGPTLEAEIADGGPLGATDLYELADQLADALRAVHAAGVVHRDLKPSNVLISPEGPVLIDFGIAHGLEDARMTSVGFVMGTPGYLAPELIDRGAPSPASDWWGWAAMLVYAATGRAPFGVRPLDAVIARAHSGDPDTAGLGPITTAALRGALDANPSRRWSAERVVGALRDAAEHGDLPGARAGMGGYGAFATTVSAPDGTVVVAPPAPGTEVVGAPERGTEVVGGDVWADPTARLGGLPEHAGAPSGFAPGATVAAGQHDAGVGSTSVMPQSLQPDPAGWPETYPPQQAGLPGGPGPSPDPFAAPFPGPPQHAGYVRPTPRYRSVAVLALLPPLVLAGATYPGRTAVVLVLLVLLSRVVGVVHSTFHTRREHRGVRGSDGVQAVLRAPWHVLRSVLATVPSALIAASAVLVLCGPVWWGLSTGRVVVGDETQPWVYGAVLMAATLVSAVVLWFGPLTSVARHGARVVLGTVAPGWVGTLVLVLLAALASWFLLGQVLDAHPVVWAPLQEPPRFDQ